MVIQIIGFTDNVTIVWMYLDLRLPLETRKESTRGHELRFTAHPERPEIAQGSQPESSASFPPTSFSGASPAMEARVLSWIIWIFVAPTVIAICMVSLSSSSVAPCCLATARQYWVHG